MSCTTEHKIHSANEAEKMKTECKTNTIAENILVFIGAINFLIANIRQFSSYIQFNLSILSMNRCIYIGNME
jgi:uncharacterized membrane protein